MDQPTTKPAIDPASFFTPGTIAERVELQLGVLTQGVVECMILATGAYPQLTEGADAAPNPFGRPKAAPASSYQAARSAELRDAARLSEASARLLTGFAKLRGQFSQDFTIRHSDRRRGTDRKNRQHNTTITHSFSVPQKHAVGEDNVDPKMTSQLTRGLAQAAESLSRSNPAISEIDRESVKDQLRRSYDLARQAKDADGQRDDKSKAE